MFQADLLGALQGANNGAAKPAPAAAPKSGGNGTAAATPAREA